MEFWIDDTGEEFIEFDMSTWPNCTTPDCEWKQCTWAGLPLCFKCAERVVGHEEMVRRYDATHDITWEEAKRLEALDKD